MPVLSNIPTVIKLEKCFASPSLNKSPDIHLCPDLVKSTFITEEMFDVTDCPFDPNEITQHIIKLPPLNIGL